MFYFRRLKHIEETQNMFALEGLVETCIMLLNKSNNDIMKEVMALLSNMLFNANKNVQVN